MKNGIDMNQFTKEELEEAQRALDSTIGKCEKVQPKLNHSYIQEFQTLLQTTNLQKGYQELIKFFRSLRTYLQKELPEYTFTGNIVENNMDYAYFQFTNEALKSKGLKIVIAFVYSDFTLQIWLSGFNRVIQCKYYEALLEKDHPYTLTENPNKTDYILEMGLIESCNYNDIDGSLKIIKENTLEFIHNVGKL